MLRRLIQNDQLKHSCFELKRVSNTDNNPSRKGTERKPKKKPGIVRLLKSTKKNSKEAAATKIQAFFRGRTTRMDFVITCLETKLHRIESNKDEELWSIKSRAQQEKHEYSQRGSTLSFSSKEKGSKKKENILNAKIDESFCLIQKLQGSNILFQQQNDELKKQLIEQQFEKRRLEKANALAQNYYEKLTEHVDYMQDLNQTLTEDASESKDDISLLSDGYNRAQQLIKKEEKIRIIYQNKTVSILQRMKEGCKDKELLEKAFITAMSCKKRIEDKKKLIPQQVTKTMPLDIYFKNASKGDKHKTIIEDDDVSSISYSVLGNHCNQSNGETLHFEGTPTQLRNKSQQFEILDSINEDTTPRERLVNLSISC